MKEPFQFLKFINNNETKHLEYYASTDVGKYTEHHLYTVIPDVSSFKYSLL